MPAEVGHTRCGHSDVTRVPATVNAEGRQLEARTPHSEFWGVQRAKIKWCFCTAGVPVWGGGGTTPTHPVSTVLKGT